MTDKEFMNMINKIIESRKKGKDTKKVKKHFYNLIDMNINKIFKKANKKFGK